MQDKFTNVEAFADADFDMDIDCNFHESESLFYGKLGFIKKDEIDSDEEETEEPKKSSSPEETKDADTVAGETTEDNNDVKLSVKPVTFLERPIEVRNA